MAKIGKRKTECLVKDTTVVLLKPYWDAGTIRFYENVVFGICGKVVASDYLLAARIDWSGRCPKEVCSTCFLIERRRQRQLVRDERDYLDRMGIIQTVEDNDDDNDGGNVPAPH
jgi:hypothetical protein